MTKLRKLKRSHPLAAVAITLLLFSTGCSQKMAPVIPEKTLPTTITDWTNSGFANPLNPFDSIGHVHNLGLNYIHSLMGGVYDTSAIAGDVRIFLNARYGTNIDTMVLKAKFLDSIYSISPRLPLVTEIYDSLYSLLLSGTTLQRYATEGDSLITDSSLTIDTAISKFMLIEDSVVGDGSLSSIQRSALLAYLAIERYSYAYWSSSAGSTWPYRAFHKSKFTPLMDNPSLSNTALCDAVGFAGGFAGGFVGGGILGGILGFFGGGPMGSLILGTEGALYGSFAGGLSGALGGSIAGGITGNPPNFWGDFGNGMGGGLIPPLLPMSPGF